MFFLEYRLSNRKPKTGYEVSPFKLLIKGIRKVPQTIQPIFIPMAYPSELDSDHIAENTTHTGQMTWRNQAGTNLELSPLLA